MWQAKVSSSPSKAGPSQDVELAEMQQGLYKANAALEGAQSQLLTRQEEVQEVTQRLEAAQADIASLQVVTSDNSVLSLACFPVLCIAACLCPSACIYTAMTCSAIHWEKSGIHQ